MIVDLLIYGTSIEIHTGCKALIKDLKRLLPEDSLAYDSDRQVWLVGMEEMETVQEVCGWHFDSVQVRYVYDLPQAAKVKVVERKIVEPIRRREAPTPYSTLHLLPDAPVEVVTAAYRALAQLHHPDRGGSGHRMAQINAAYEQIGKERT